MSTIAVKKVKLGDNADLSKNFLIEVPAVADGTLTIKRENGTNVLSIGANGKAVIPGVVGTVAQVGGVPTGQVVERGSNANGEYVRFADGTQICFFFRRPASALSNKRISFAWPFPAAFLSQPPVLTGAIDLNAVFVSGWNTDAFYIATTETSETVGTLSITTDYSGAATGWGNQRASLTAIGRWF